MPSLDHEALITLFRNRPALVPALLHDTQGIALPDYTDVRIESSDLTHIQPAEYRADLVVVLSNDKPNLGIVLEVQLASDGNKKYSWPAYVTNLRARNRCPVCLFVITADDDVTRWAGKAIDLGGGNYFTPRVLSLSGIPEITDQDVACKEPELAVLSALGHANDPDPEKSARIALMAQMAGIGLDVDRSGLYCDLVLNALPEIAHRALLEMNVKKYEYQSEFARRYYGQGMAQGRTDMLFKMLMKRYGALAPAAADQVRNASATEQEYIAERVLTAETLEEALGACGTATQERPRSVILHS